LQNEYPLTQRDTKDREREGKEGRKERERKGREEKKEGREGGKKEGQKVSGGQEVRRVLRLSAIQNEKNVNEVLRETFNTLSVCSEV
jgi:hypothetical protein